jgi:hypothetical protein
MLDDKDFEQQRADRIKLAREALVEYIAEHPDEPLGDMWDYFFPPSSLPFDRGDLRSALLEGLYTRRINLSEDRRLQRNDVPRSCRD